MNLFLQQFVQNLLKSSVLENVIKARITLLTQSTRVAPITGISKIEDLGIFNIFLLKLQGIMIINILPS